MTKRNENQFSWRETSDNGGTVTGTDKLYGGSIEFNWDSLDEAIQLALRCFALKTILTTRTSSEDRENKLDAMLEYKELLQDGQWAKKRQKAEPPTAAERALAQIKMCSIAALRKALAKYDATTRDQILTSEAVLDRIASMQKADAGGVDLDDLIES